MSLSLLVVISPDTDEHHYESADNPTCTSHYITTNGITVRQDGPTKELINPIYGSDVRVEDVSTSTDTKGFEAAYSLGDPKANSTTDGGLCGNTIRDYEYVTVPT